MQKTTCEELLDKPRFIKVDRSSVFDEKTIARLQRENDETWKGLLALKALEKVQKKQAPELQQKDAKIGKHEVKDETRLTEEPKKDYRFTKWSKSKILRQREEKKKWEKYLNQRREMKFRKSLIEFKILLSHLEWHRTCHLHERTIIRRNIRLDRILKIKWKYKIDDILSPDSTIFQKILKHERERKEQLKLRRERTRKIISKIALEMNNGIRLFKKPADTRAKKVARKETRKESSSEISFEEIRSEESEIVQEDLIDVPLIEKPIPDLGKKGGKISDFESKGDKTAMVKRDVEAEEEEEVSGDKDNFEKLIATRESKSSVERVLEQDTCFFAVPSMLAFQDFEVKKKYSRRVLIRNKTAKWAYLRFHKIYTEVWESGIIEIDVMDAVRLKPGLHATVNVKFSPIHEEEVTAEISFLTLSQDYPESFHEFRVPVRCTPQCALPVLDPKELRFPSAPIWRYDDPKFNERTLTISNEGRKPFSILIEERNDQDNYFLWHFDEDDMQSVQSSILCINESGSEEIKTENVSEDTSNNQKPRKKYQIEVPAKVKCHLRITFRPRYVGLHHEVLEICFLSENRILGKQSVPIWTEVTSCQIHLDPPCVDLGILMVDCDVRQQTFNIVNTGRSSVEVSMKTPKCLGDQVSVYPKSTIVNSESSSKINVRLTPESNIFQVSKRFYDPVSNMLTIPVQVQTVLQGPEKPPPLILKVLASLTTCHALVLEPVYVELGHVHTHESVYTELTLTNESLLIQEYAFVNLPPFMEVHPNHGFGAILPGQTITLHLIYSACLTDIPGNEIGANGLSGERSFQIRVVTLAELTGSKERATLNKLKDQANLRSIIPKNRGIPPPVPFDVKTAKKIRATIDEDKDDLGDQSDSDSIANERDSNGKEEILDTSMEKFEKPKERKEKNSIEVYVYIIDTLCEFSEQIIEFPATPCGSFSMASVHLRGFNMASYPHCTCGIIKDQHKEFTASYEIKSSSDRMKIMPQSGTFRNNEVIPINFMFRPRLPRSMIFEEGLRLKMNVEEQEAKLEKVDKEKKRKRDEQKKSVSDVDKLDNEVSLLETFEPCVSTIFLTCKIDLEMKDGSKRDELLFLKLVCPITKPEILILNEDREIVFGATAIGTCSRRFLLVKNISNQNVKVDVSLLDPCGPFFVPPGKTIETGSILKLPVTYQPKEDQDEDRERFQVSSSRTRTIWMVKVRGRGVVPSYVIKPQFRVARFEVTDEMPVELRISIQNTGSCPLIFRLSLVDELEGEIPRVQEESRLKPDKKKRKGKAESSGKSGKKVEFGDYLRSNEELAIFGGNLERSMDRSRFSFRNVDENMQILVPEGKKMEFGVQFQAINGRKNSFGRNESNKIPEKASKEKKKSKTKKKVEELRKSNYCHVALLKLTLGSSTSMDFIMICWTN